MKSENKLLIFQLLGFLKIYRLPYPKEKTNQENRFETTAINSFSTITGFLNDPSFDEYNPTQWVLVPERSFYIF